MESSNVTLLEPKRKQRGQGESEGVQAAVPTDHPLDGDQPTGEREGRIPISEGRRHRRDDSESGGAEQGPRKPLIGTRHWKKDNDCEEGNRDREERDGEVILVEPLATYHRRIYPEVFERFKDSERVDLRRAVDHPEFGLLLADEARVWLGV